jgi:hypothetical protein
MSMYIDYHDQEREENKISCVAIAVVLSPERDSLIDVRNYSGESVTAVAETFVIENEFVGYHIQEAQS